MPSALQHVVPGVTYLERPEKAHLEKIVDRKKREDRHYSLSKYLKEAALEKAAREGHPFKP